MSPPNNSHFQCTQSPINLKICCIGWIKEVSLAFKNLITNPYAHTPFLTRSPSPLASYNQKLFKLVFKLDDHVGVASSGLTADARSLMTHMRNECLNHTYAFDSPMVTGRLVSQVADKHQKCTQGMTAFLLRSNQNLQKSDPELENILYTSIFSR